MTFRIDYADRLRFEHTGTTNGVKHNKFWEIWHTNGTTYVSYGPLFSAGSQKTFRRSNKTDVVRRVQDKIRKGYIQIHGEDILTKTPRKVITIPQEKIDDSLKILQELMNQ